MTHVAYVSVSRGPLPPSRTFRAPSSFILPMLRLPTTFSVPSVSSYHSLLPELRKALFTETVRRREGIDIRRQEEVKKPFAY